MNGGEGFAEGFTVFSWARHIKWTTRATLTRQTTRKTAPLLALQKKTIASKIFVDKENQMSDIALVSGTEPPRRPQRPHPQGMGNPPPQRRPQGGSRERKLRAP